MIRMRSSKVLFPMFFLILFMVVATAGTVFSEMTLNDDIVNVEGALSLDDENIGVIFVDGSRQTVAAAPPWCKIIPTDERFVLVMYNNGAVLDRETGLVWEKDTSDTLYDWSDALEYCYEARIGGRCGWRLPTVAELRTLTDRTESPSLPDGHPFTNARDKNYWTSTPEVSASGNAWIVNFLNGYVGYRDKGQKYHVRAVRSGR